MSVTPVELGLYALGLAGLWLTPGPVWVALTARALAGGFGAAWPLALGVTLGDLLWPLLAILGMAWVISTFAWAFVLMKVVAALTFVVLGVLVWRSAGRPIAADGRLTRPGRWAGFSVGVTAVLANPKAIVFYMGMLPGFFDLGTLTGLDVAAILALSVAIPLAGNLLLARLVGRARDLLSSPRALVRLTRGAGAMLVGVGLLIPLL